MNPNDNDDSRSAALYWDFENLQAGLMKAKYGEGAYRHWPSAPRIAYGGGGEAVSARKSTMRTTGLSPNICASTQA